MISTKWLPALLDAVDPRRRRSFVVGSRVHVEIRCVPGERFAAYCAAIERAVGRVGGVARVHVNGPLLRAVADFGEGTPRLEDVAAAIEAVERELVLEDLPFARDRLEHPGDEAAIARLGLELSADTAALAMALAGRVAGVGVRALQIDVLALLTTLRGSPYLRGLVEQTIGAAASDLVLTLAGAAAQGFAQSTVGPLVDLGYRLLFLSELVSRRSVWLDREHELFGDDQPHVPPLDEAERAGAMPPGPIERYSDQAFYGSIGAFGVGVAATGSLAEATAPLVGGSPRPAHVGRHAFVAWLGRALARRGILILDGGRMRLLDRIDTVVLDGGLVASFEVDAESLVASDETRATELRRQVARLFDRDAPLAGGRDGEWTLRRARHDASRGLPGIVRNAIATFERQGRTALLISSRKRRLHGVLALRRTLRRDVEDLARALRQAGVDVQVASAEAAVREVLPEAMRAAAALAGDPSALIADLQRGGKVVCFVTAGSTGTARAADLVVGLRRGGASPPWGCHVLCGPSLADCGPLLRAVAAAREVASQGVAVAEAAAAIGLVLALGGLRWQTTPAVSQVVDLASLVSMVNGIRLAAKAVGTAGDELRDDDSLDWHALEPDVVLARLGSSLDGLAQPEAERRRTRTHEPPSTTTRYLEAGVDELANPLTPVLGAAASLSAAVGSIADAMMVAGVAAFNAVTGAVQRVQAEEAVGELDRGQLRRVRVLRDGGERTCDADELVPGDVIRLEAGDAVPADCRLLTADGLEVDESSVTGESLPVRKDPTPSYATVLAERTSMLYADTSIAAGRARAVVVAVGDRTEARRARAAEGAPPESGVELRMRSLLNFTSPVAVASGAIVAVNGLLRGMPFADVVGSAVGLTVAAIPEGLPMIATLAQLAAARRLSQRGALVKNARAVEALGRMNVVCLDKTGTVTEGRIHLTCVSDGRRTSELRDAAPAIDPVLAGVLRVALRATPVPKPGRMLPHLTDRAVEEAASYLANAPEDDRQERWQVVAELPFEPARAYHAALGRVGDAYELCVKGAPEVVLERCTRAKSRTLDARGRARLEAEAHRLARQGLRVLAVARRQKTTNGGLGDEHVRELEFAGFVGLSDPVRESARPAIRALREAGVRLVMMTGDHPSTAEHIAASLGLIERNGVLTGADIDRLDDDELDRRLADTVVLARLTPTHKVRIVQAYQRLRFVVGMTGDGANDAPAIRLAHVGIALGRDATSAARAAADVVITDDRVETLVDAVLEGRAMWSSVRDAISLLLGGNLGELAFIVAGSLATGASPLNARQLLLVNLLTDAAPALATALRPPRAASPETLLAEGPEASLGRALERDVVWRALATAGGATVAWLAARPFGPQRAGTVALASLVTSQLGQTLVTGGRSPLVLAASVGSFAATVGAIQTPGVSGLLGCTPLGPVGWSLALGSSALATGASVVLPRALPGAADWIIDLVRNPGDLVPRLPGLLRASSAGDAPAEESEHVQASDGSLH